MFILSLEKSINSVFSPLDKDTLEAVDQALTPSANHFVRMACKMAGTQCYAPLESHFYLNQRFAATSICARFVQSLAYTHPEKAIQPTVLHFDEFALPELFSETESPSREIPLSMPQMALPALAFPDFVEEELPFGTDVETTNPHVATLSSALHYSDDCTEIQNALLLNWSALDKAQRRRFVSTCVAINQAILIAVWFCPGQNKDTISKFIRSAKLLDYAKKWKDYVLKQRISTALFWDRKNKNRETNEKTTDLYFSLSEDTYNLTLRGKFAVLAMFGFEESDAVYILNSQAPLFKYEHNYAKLVELSCLSLLKQDRADAFRRKRGITSKVFSEYLPSLKTTLVDLLKVNGPRTLEEVKDLTNRDPAGNFSSVQQVERCLTHLLSEKSVELHFGYYFFIDLNGADSFAQCLNAWEQRFVAPNLYHLGATVLRSLFQLEWETNAFDILSTFAYIPEEIEDQVFSVKDSLIPSAGRGLFANVDLPKALCIGYRGHLKPETQYAPNEEVNYGLTIDLNGVNTVINALDDDGCKVLCAAAYANHKPESEAQFGTHQIFLASEALCFFQLYRDCPAGEELFVNYGPQLGQKFEKITDSLIEPIFIGS